MNRNNYKTKSQQWGGWAFYLVMAVAVMCILAGCGSMKPVDPALAGKVEVQVTKVEKVYIMVDESLLGKCQKPQKINDLIPELKTGKVSEKALLTALTVSRSNEINCWLVKEESVKLQRSLKADQEAGK